MLLTREELAGIRDGAVSTVFRRWAEARVKPGTRLRTAVGIVAVDDVSVVEAASLRPDDATEAGFASIDDLLAHLRRFGERPIHRIRLRYAGADPRVGLRETIAGHREAREIQRQLQKYDARSPKGPWTSQVLWLIRANPGVRAADLAQQVGTDRSRFKRNVRKLKELGLTESLDVGYRLSPRGLAYLEEEP